MSKKVTEERRLGVVEATDRFERPPIETLLTAAVDALRDLERAILEERLDGRETYPEYVYGPISSFRRLLERV